MAARWSQVEEVKAANKLVEEFTKSDSRLTFINVFPHMMGPDGLPKPDIFVADRLHMNSAGYEIWKEQIRPFLKYEVILTPAVCKECGLQIGGS